MPSQRYNKGSLDHHDRNGRSRDSRSRSRSHKSSRHNHHHSRRNSRSRSRSRSLDRRRHHRHHLTYSRSRSRSRSHNGDSSRRDKRNTSRRYKDSRSRSHSNSRTTSTRSHKNKHRSRSQTPRNKDNDHKLRGNENVHRSEKHKSTEVSDFNNSNNTSTDQHENTQHQYQQVAQESENNSMEANLDDLPLPQMESDRACYNFDDDEPIDKERIHREMEEKLRAALAKEGKVYPPKKPEASHPVFANDGSFLEIFKRMQEAQQQMQPVLTTATVPQTDPLNTSPLVATTKIVGKPPAPISQPPPVPFVGRRRGGKILKTGVVAKQRAHAENGSDPNDFWSLYLAEVSKYRNTACKSEAGTRPLLK